jgi:hypothetical protein
MSGCKPLSSDYGCKDCGEVSDSPMYKDELWLSVMPSKNGYLCVECFERRIGRMITLDDLNNSLWSKVLIKLVNRAKQGLL